LASLYQAFVDVVPETKGLKAKLSKEFGAAGPGAGAEAGKGVKSGLLGSVGKLAGPLAVAFAGLGIGKIIKDSIGNASDLAEAGTAITAVFGDADATIQKFAAGSANSLGQSTNQTLDAARVFGVFGKSAGLGGEELASFSTDFITLAGDLASFNNTSPEEAIQALGAGLRGESEPLRKYGVLLDDAALKARATELGIYSGTGALTAQQKVLASQAEIMAQTGVAQGDFAKTSGGLANQQRILEAGMTNLSTAFGALFLPAATAVVGFLNRSVIPALSNVIPAIQGIKSILVDGDFKASFFEAFNIQEDSPIVDFLFNIREAFIGIGSSVGPIFSTISSAFAPLVPVFAALVPQLLELWQSFSPLSLIFQSIGPMLPQLVNAFAGLATTLGGALGAALSQILPTITQFSGLLVGLIGSLITTLLPIIVELVGIIGPVLGAVIAGVMPLVSSLQGVFVQLFGAVQPLLAPVLALIVPLVKLIGAVLPPLIQLFVAILTPIIALASGIISILVPAITFIITALSTVIGWIAKALTFFVQLVTGAGDAGRKLSDFFSGIPRMISDAFGNLVSIGANAGRDLIGGFIDGIKKMIGKVGDAIGGVMDFVGGFFPHSPAKRGPFSGSGWRAVLTAGTAIGKQFNTGLEDSMPDVGSMLGSSVSTGAFTSRVDASVYGSAARGGASGAAVYVQNPFTGEYLLAKVGQVAGSVVKTAANARDSQIRRN
jgi:hypothetical protein